MIPTTLKETIIKKIEAGEMDPSGQLKFEGMIVFIVNSTAHNDRPQGLLMPLGEFTHSSVAYVVYAQ
jgi:hypothetical protein